MAYALRPRVPQRTRKKEGTHEQYGGAGAEGVEMADIKDTLKTGAGAEFPEIKFPRVPLGQVLGSIKRGAKRLFTGLIPGESDETHKLRGQRTYYEGKLKKPGR